MTIERAKECVTTENHHIFRYFDDVWICEISAADGQDFSVEIYQEEYDDELLVRILSFLETDAFDTLKSDGLAQLAILSTAFWGAGYSDAAFDFQGVTIGMDSDSDLSDFQLIYHMSSALNDFDDYANWIVDIKDYRVVGVRRQQL
ncbi:hypothetical protein [Shewanella sp.]|uniref:hypothetical protein n=1 Tax=Shewanella sp. TaxID=50422 RepID=UPI00356931F2